VVIILRLLNADSGWCVQGQSIVVGGGLR